MPQDQRARARQARYLAQRGFDSEVIARILLIGEE
jgi:SOS response regulatory protein OraA/RecX